MLNLIKLCLILERKIRMKKKEMCLHIFSLFVLGASFCYKAKNTIVLENFHRKNEHFN